MLFIRSAIFNCSFYLANAIIMVFWLPSFFILSKKNRWKIVKLWSISLLWLQYIIVGTNFDFRGVENIPAGANLLVAGKHQSAWETYTLVLFFDDPAYILKRSLMRLPLFGWYAANMQTVPIDRGRGSVALASITKNATAMMAKSPRQIIIYAEGTRKLAGAPAKYKYGITHLYNTMNTPVLPVALNSGLFWARESFLRYPGTILLEFMPPIKPGLKKEVFAKKLQKIIEAKTLEQMKETAKTKNPPPLAKQFL